MAQTGNITINIEVSQEDRELLLALLGRSGKSSATTKEAVVEEVEADDEGGDDFEAVTEEELRGISFAELKTYAVDEWDVDPAGKKTSGLVKAILEAQDAFMEDQADTTPDDDEDEDDVEEEVDEDEDDEEVEEDEDEEGDEDDDEFWTEAELNQKTIGELKAIARDYDIPTKGMKAPQIVQAIIDA
jgi:folate-binding Fe-S cluster repair protein YgfZ